jgi:hypothetical protein
MSNEYSQEFKMCTVSWLLIKALLVVGFHELLALKKGQAELSDARRSGHCFWRGGGESEEVVGWTLWYVVKQLTHICTLNLLKPWRSVSGDFDITKMLLKSSFNTTHDHTRVLKHRKQSQYSG